MELAIGGGRPLNSLTGFIFDAAVRYRDKGMLASIGRGAAVADFGRIKLSGLLAWIT